MLYDDFQYINIIAVRKKILFLCLENIATQKRGNIKSPEKSESFPVNQFPKVVLKKSRFPLPRENECLESDKNNLKKRKSKAGKS